MRIQSADGVNVDVVPRCQAEQGVAPAHSIEEGVDPGRDDEDAAGLNQIHVDDVVEAGQRRERYVIAPGDYSEGISRPDDVGLCADAEGDERYGEQQEQKERSSEHTILRADDLATRPSP